MASPCLRRTPTLSVGAAAMSSYAALVEDENDDESELEMCAAQAESTLAALSRVLVAAEAVPASEADQVQTQLRQAAQVAERQRQLFERQEAAGLHLLKLQRLRHGLGALVDRWKQVKCTYLP